MRIRDPPASCSVPGCDQPASRRHMCEAHYRRQLHSGNPGAAAIRPPRDPICTVDGCNEPHKAQGLCNKHYKRLRATGHTRTKTINRRTRNRQARQRAQQLIDTKTN